MIPNDLIAAASFTPKSLVSPNSWVGHLPFAAWVTQEVLPKIFVELGTHSGNSYFAFCQSVLEKKIATKCYAVDTWHGDEHAGHYNDDIFNTVNAHNQERYADFSQLLRMTFDDALANFADESIELLHIDGLHTYEAVLHDFETWLPKLAPGAVVMFHDTNVRERDFGVWKLWEELQTSYPNNLEFMHSYGLGVLQLNNSPDKKKLKWLQSDYSEKSVLIEYFASIGLIHSNALEAKEQTQLAQSLDQELTERTKWAQSLDQELTERTKWAQSLDQELQSLQQELLTERTKYSAIISSSSWRLSLPLREAKLWLTYLKKQSSRYIKLILAPVRKVYHKSFLCKRRLAKTIKIPTSKKPLVSVIIPIYGQIDYTLRCLISIAAHLPNVQFEVIVVDDCSPDKSFKVLKNIKGIKLIKNKKNQGFIRSCNSGALIAKGQYLHFLNNDTEVTSGWLDELLLTFDQFPGTGFVGSKLLYPDGSLQEAGGIIWQDGNAWNFGRLQDPLLPVFNYAREVDYCSGASIIVPKALFEKLGGFDEHYLPAYCEDADLALKIRDKGYRVLYQPTSIVIHYEGITSGTDTSCGIKAYQVDNMRKLYKRWKIRLLTHQPNGVDVDSAKDRCTQRRVLVIDECTPTPNQDAGSLLTFNILLLLREMGFQITFIPADNFLYQPEYTTQLQRAGIEVLYEPYVKSVVQHLKDSGDRYDLAFLFRPISVEKYCKVIRELCPKAKILFHTVDLHFLRMCREAELQLDNAKLRASEKMKLREFAAIVLVDATIVVSTTELELLQLALPDSKIYLFPLIMDVLGISKAFSMRKDIVFVGGYQHTPNIDAVQYFVTEIMPLLRTRLPGVKFYAVGSNVPPEIERLGCSDVIIKGFIEDLNPFLDKMRISVAPLRYGAGIKGKISGAMAIGLPVVATPLAAEGMLLQHNENILLAEGVEEFVDAIAKLYEDETLWNHISQNGLIHAENAWGAEVAYNGLKSILTNLQINTEKYKSSLTLYKQFF